MTQTKELLERYKQIRARLRYPPNAVPDTGINLRGKYEPLLPPKAEEPTIKVEIKSNPPPPPKPLLPGVTFSSTLQITASEFGISQEEIRSKTRVKTIAFPRQIALYIAAEKHKRGLSWIGRYLDMDHTTVLYARDKISKMVSSDPELRDRIEQLENKIALYGAATLSANNQSHLETRQEGDVQVSPIPPMDS